MQLDHTRGAAGRGGARLPRRRHDPLHHARPQARARYRARDAAPGPRRRSCNDIPVASGVDDTHMTRDVLGEAERLAADAFGAERSFFLLNGSSIGNQAALLAVAGPGDEVVVARNVHKSIMTALILSGARPVYVRPPLRRRAGGRARPGRPTTSAATLDAHPARQGRRGGQPHLFRRRRRPARAGRRLPRPRHPAASWTRRGRRTFPFHPDLPPSAMACGRRRGVASIHKVLTGFTQSSILNLQGPRDRRGAGGALAGPAADHQSLRLYPGLDRRLPPPDGAARPRAAGAHARAGRMARARLDAHAGAARAGRARCWGGPAPRRSTGPSWSSTCGGRG